MLPRFAPDPGVRSVRSAEPPFAAVGVGALVLPCPADGVRPPEGALAEWLRDSPPGWVRADVGFIGRLDTRRSVNLTLPAPHLGPLPPKSPGVTGLPQCAAVNPGGDDTQLVLG